jgi:P-aminobenzoate N-oxygenase AurF.
MTRPMSDWHRQAGVRSTTRRILNEDREGGLTLFPEKLIPYLHHQALADVSADARHELMARHLYQYMLFTVHLETKVVNRGTALIANDEADFRIDPETRLGAFKIYCDEGYHALSSLDIVQQIEKVSGIPCLPYDFAPRMARLQRTADRFLSGRPGLAHLLQVAVFETAVTSLLADIPRDPTVHRVVREVVGDHARDEAHHHAFFSRFFRELWANLPTGLRSEAARSLPHFIHDCLHPDIAPVQASLLAAGLPEMLVKDVLADTYTQSAVRAVTRRSARHTLALVESVGAFELPGVREELHAAGLIE